MYSTANDNEDYANFRKSAQTFVNNNKRDQRENNLKKKKAMRMRFLIPIQKYFNPIKYIYYMDMVFPLNVLTATEGDYHAGKINLVRNAQMRPKVVYDKKTQYVLVIMEAPTMHVMQDQCEYFLEYLRSLGSKTLKDFSDILENWKTLWTIRKIANITGGCRLEPGEVDMMLGNNPEESLEEIYDYRIKTNDKVTPTCTFLKKLYFIERTVKYKGDNIVFNSFTIGYSKHLLSMLKINHQAFMAGLSSYKIPITVKALDNMTYRYNMISMMMYGNFPRLGCHVKMASDKFGVDWDPYLTCNRMYSQKNEALNIRLSYSYKDQSDLKFYNEPLPEEDLPCSIKEFTRKSVYYLLPKIQKKINKLANSKN